MQHTIDKKNIKLKNIENEINHIKFKNYSDKEKINNFELETPDNIKKN